ncbi:LysM-like peptidoglycan-binding domain-containing protein [Lonepinella sp. BR2474]|uniref:LysM-like peptidoglycan-binding domain-containing protein n=1 Tax=Lonepinella sp. BR2474 TaxID=3434548 RepID=UPI003F6E401A
MENTPKNNPSQSELDLGTNQTDSILSKVTGLFNKKEGAQPTQFAVRKEPTFGSQPTAPQATATPSQNINASPNVSASMAQNVTHYSTSSSFQQGNYLNTTHTAQSVSNENGQENVTTPVSSVTEPTQPTAAETVVAETTGTVETPTAESPTVPQTDTPESVEQPVVVPTSSKASNKNPENWAIMQKLPTKHRRLFIAIAGAVAILLALLWLKPSNNTVEEIQANNSSSTPIEFQSLNPNEPLPETTENVTMADNNATANSTVAPAEQANVNPAPQATAETTTAAPTQAIAPTTPETAAAASQPVNSATEQAKAEQAKLAAEQARKAEQAKLAAEQARKAEQARLAAEQARKAEQAKVAAQQAHKAETKTTASKAKTAPVVDAKPASTSSSASSNKASSANTSASKATSTNATSGTKTLVVPQGTSLFQVFRSNGLDIRDANAMTKANGAGNVLSSFKANDKVQVSVSQGRVNSMRLSDGSVFTRQADGTYKYSK